MGQKPKSYNQFSSGNAKGMTKWNILFFKRE
ncbi:hypothetical protein VPHD260_0093 [Vibrio phage D260]